MLRLLPWNCRLVIGTLNCPSDSTLLNVAMSLRQDARVCIDPKRSYEKAVMRVARCLRHAANFVILYELDVSKGKEVFAENNFVQ